VSDERIYEDAVLEKSVARWSEQGYRVLRHPMRDEVPEFLRPYEPDALALDKQPQLVIEVVRDDTLSVEKIRRIQQLMKDQAKWRLELVYDRSRLPSGIVGVPVREVRDAVSEVRKLVDADDQRAALLMAWATLEAVTRVLEPAAVERPQTPGRVVEVLTSLGYLDQSEAERLRTLASARNALVHGQLDVAPDPGEVRGFVRVLERLAVTASVRTAD
jgi:uncharacterized protein YutE (UPF0331/DUF86 family)